MPVIHVLDVNFQQKNEAIASFLIESGDGLILIESGPESTFVQLEKALQQKGYSVADVKHLFLTHIHFDHAGAAWKFAQNGTKIYVHPIGLPHLEAPQKLWQSAKQIYTDKMEQLWGTMEPIDSNSLIAANDGDIFEIGSVKIKTIYTPGHAVHHNAYKINNYLFTGDVAGVKIENGPIVPPCPPPDIDIALWKKSISKLRVEDAEGLYLTHFGYHQHPNALFDELENALDDWAQFIKPYFEQGVASEQIVPLFMQYVHDKYYAGKVNPQLLQAYEYANPSWMSVNGLLRYWKLKSQGRIE